MQEWLVLWERHDDGCRCTSACACGGCPTCSLRSAGELEVAVRNTLVLSSSMSRQS